MSEHAGHNVQLQDTLAQYRQGYDDQLASVQKETDLEIEALPESYRSQQASTDDRLKKVNESYCAQIGDLHRLLNKEGQQLQTARSEVQAMQCETSKRR
jgi:hypothetical protein